MDLLEAWKEKGLSLVDLRTPEIFSELHLIGSTNIPGDELHDRMQELPERGETIALLGSPEATKIAQDLIGTGYTIFATFHDSSDLWSYTTSKGWTESGYKSKRLWKPCPFLEEVIERIESAILTENRRAIDIACGSGRDCIYLAGRGWNILGVDNVELRLTKLHEVTAREKAHVTTLCLDLEPDLAPDLGAAEPNWEHVRASLLKNSSTGYDLVHVARYLHRPLMPILREIIRPGGFIVYHTFMVPSMGKPRRPRFLLNPNELLETFEGFEVVEFRESKFPDGRPAQYLCARKPK
eukprot:Phypoly_transcript_12005.p1 GENE.Phypoly_transcript_12005~~Phypoly_transcript_12005.p1  ORF type:complete len:296 (-),score=23.45 Phypoly_transcript_12005:61-948(-)